MQYVVSWWEGVLKRHTILKDKDAAEKKRLDMKERSASLPLVSLEPVRMMPRVVFEKMDELVKTKSDTWKRRCKHAPFRRLCVVCVGEEVL
jgi:hypothetical protein